MKRYYNPTTHEWYTEGQPMTRKIEGGVFTGIPSEERLKSWGFEEWHEPTPTPEQQLEVGADNEYCEKHCKGYRDTGGRCFADGRCDAYWEYQKQKGTMNEIKNEKMSVERWKH